MSAETSTSMVQRMYRIGIVAAAKMAAIAWLSATSLCLVTVAQETPDRGVAPRVEPAAPQSGAWANVYDRKLGAILSERQSDWRDGAVVYQVFVDRFAPSASLEAKRALYPQPKVLHPWSDLPAPGTYSPATGRFTHELDFWGGDLKSLASKLGYVSDLGVQVLYLNPIHAAYTNHKYDALDFAEVSPEYGTREDVIALAKACHERGLRLVLDGVFNHMGRNSPKFQSAIADPKSPYRDWFFVSDRFRAGFRAWANVANLPELNLENPEVRAHIWEGHDSVVQRYLRDGVDGWRLDVAYDLGFKYLADLTAVAHAVRPQSLVVGELWNYPEEWSPSVDAVMNFHLRQIIFELVDGTIRGAVAGRAVERMIADCGIDPILKSWVQLDNHDTSRIMSRIPNQDLRRLAQVLQFTLPGSPLIYYGSELGMTGAGDPANRAPMRWDLDNGHNDELAWIKKLVQLHNQSRALRIGDFRLLDTSTLLAFSRRTDHVGELVIVVANPTPAPVREAFSTRESKLMNGHSLRDRLDPRVSVQVSAGRVELEVPARTIRVLQTDAPDPIHSYSPYKRVQ